MTRYVIDASATVEYLLKTQLGKSIAAAVENSVLVAPELMDVEVVAVLRRAVLREELSEDRALVALDDLSGWPVERISHRALAKSAWRHRHNLTAYDAFYVGHGPCLGRSAPHGGRAAVAGATPRHHGPQRSPRLSTGAREARSCARLPAEIR